MSTTLRNEIYGPGIRLCRCHPGHADALIEAILESRAELSRWLPWCHAGYKPQETIDWLVCCDAAWDRGDEFSFVIEDSRSGQLLGGCGVHHVDRAEGRANLGYWVRTSRTGQGVASTAAGRMAQAALEDLGLERVEILIAVDNRASQRVAEKAGATREGALRRRLLACDTMHDAVCYSLARGDCD